MPQGDDLQESDFRNRNRSQTTCDSLNRINAGVQTSKTQKSQGSQESQGVNSSACSMPNSDFSRVAEIAGVAASQFPHVPVDILPASLKAAFQERAAIAEVEGGLDREAAERLAWDEVNAGPLGDTLQDWRAWMNYRLRAWMARRLSPAEAMRSVWAEAETKWYGRHGAPPDLDRCAGCGEWMLDGPGMRFDDGTVVHFGNPERFDCLIIYGEAWRAAASTGLVALGLRKPQP
jgi:hypothetical protein